MKLYKLEQFLQNPEADLGTGLLGNRDLAAGTWSEESHTPDG